MAEGVRKYLPGTRVIDRTGDVVGRLTVIKHLGIRESNKKKVHYWLCRCSCEEQNEVEVSGSNLATKSVLSCGCYHRERVVETSTTHGLTRTPTWSSWLNMVNRCTYKYDDWKIYHDKDVCARWQDLTLFFADMGERPEGTTIDRYPLKDGGYWCGHPDCPDCGPLGRERNARWATPKQQANNLSTNIVVEWKGERRTLMEWAEITGFEPACLYMRHAQGWDTERMMTEGSKLGRRSELDYKPFDPVEVFGVENIEFQDGDRILYVRREGDRLLLADSPDDTSGEFLYLTEDGARRLYNLIRRKWKPGIRDKAADKNKT